MLVSCLAQSSTLNMEASGIYIRSTYISVKRNCRRIQQSRSSLNSEDSQHNNWLLYAQWLGESVCVVQVLRCNKLKASFVYLLLVYFVALSITQMTVTNELYKMWKKVFMIQFKIPSRNLPAGSGETHISRIACVPVESGTEHLPSTSQNSCPCFTLLIPGPGELKPDRRFTWPHRKP
jgi:hypothetical protein